MKKLIFITALVICCVTKTLAQYSGSGNGTENDPYLIFNENQLSQVSNFLNQEGVVFKLMKDLNLTNWIAENNPSQGWLPIGVESTPFKGVFYGNNHKITGLRINRTSTNNVGFFGYVTNATISDLTIEGTTITGSSNVGAFVGYILGSTISNCHVNMGSGNGVTGTSMVGGFVGYSNNTIYQTFSVASKVTSSSNLGGFAGKVESGTFSDGSFTGELVGSGSYTGGLIGYASGLTLTNIDIKGSITGEDFTGGIVGCNVGGSFTNCKYEGPLTGVQYVGGIVGALETSGSSFESCFSRGRISATGNNCGGVIGISKGGCIENIGNCSHFGDISGKAYVGGLIGSMISTVDAPILHNYVGSNDSNGNWSSGITYNESISNGSIIMKEIINCTAIGDVIGTSNVGGLIGSETTADVYTPSSHKISQWYVYENGVRIHYGGDFYYYTYTRNTISLNLTNSYYSGTIEGNDNVGGLYGYKSGGTIQNNYANASIYGSSNVGGVAGYISDSKINNSYNTTTLKSNVSNNSVISATSENVGRIYGKADSENVVIGALGSAEGNRGLAQTRIILQGVVQEIDDNPQQGTSIGPSLLRLKATYVSMGWNFDENWNILETECYPYKKYQAAPPIIESNLVSQSSVISGKSLDGGTVYLFYKGRDAVSTVCNGHQWSFSTEPLQSGALVQVYADVEDMTPSYFTTTNVGYPGSGTEEDPWLIYTAEDLQGACNRGYYKIKNDIDLTEWINENSPTKGWISVGRNSGESTYIDGDGHKVTGLWIEAPEEDFTGLFSNFSAGQIKNLRVEVATGKKVHGADYTGILIGRNANGLITNCSVKGNVEGTIHVGGMVGYVEATTITSATAEGGVTSTVNDAFVGGLAGQMLECSVSSSRSASTISTIGANNRVGGLAGHAKDGIITNSYANTSLSATGNANYVGGLVGYSETPITMSVSSGSVSATGDNSYTGGLVGYTLSPISNSYSTAKTTGTLYTAGLVGYTFSTIDKCYSDGDIYGVRYGGGVVGELDGSNACLTNSVAANNILSLSAQSSWGCRVIGGFKNGAADPDLSNFALSTMQVSLNNVPQDKTDDIVEGIAKTPEELKTKGTYSLIDWDFTNIWDIDTGISYPYLRDVVNSGETPDDPDEPIVSEDNALVLEDVTAAPGSQFVLPINMVNVDEVTALQFDLYLPSGVTIAEEDGELLIDLADRTTYRKHSLAFRQQADGAMRITCSSNNNATFTGNEGAIINVTLNVSSTIEEKEYVIAAKNIEISTKGGTAYNPADAKAKLSISSYLLGDADQSGKVSINDAVCIVNYILGFPNQTFLEAAADVDQNGHISINDKVVLINDYILGSDASSAKRNALSRGDASTGYLYIDNLNMQAGETRQIEVKMQTNRTDIKALQCDIVLPRGLEFVYEEEDGERYYADKGGRAARSHSVVSSIQGDGSLRVVESNDNNDSFKDNDLPVFTFTIRAVSNMAEGSYSIMLSNVELSYGQSINPDDREVVLIIGNSSISTDINAVDMGNTSYDVYNMNGQMIRKGSDNSNLPRGIYIVNGKKVVVK